jgi:hypothetical protein
VGANPRLRSQSVRFRSDGGDRLRMVIEAWSAPALARSPLMRSSTFTCFGVRVKLTPMGALRLEMGSRNQCQLFLSFRTRRIVFYERAAA